MKTRILKRGNLQDQNIIKSEAAGVLLQSTQQLRTHWSSVITTHIGYTLMVNVAIWSYFLKSYIDSFTGSSEAYPLYIVLAAALSSMTLGMWRLYAHYIDNHIAGLYPDFILYESILAVPFNRGTSGYLTRAVPILDSILSDNNLTTEQKSEGISTLVKSKRIGRRGHLTIDVLTLVVLIGMFAVSLSLQSELQSSLAIACFAGIYIGLLFTLLGLFFYQKNPSKRFIKDILSELKKNGGNDT